MLRLHRKTAVNQTLKLKTVAIKIIRIMIKKITNLHVMMIAALFA